MKLMQERGPDDFNKIGKPWPINSTLNTARPFNKDHRFKN